MHRKGMFQKRTWKKCGHIDFGEGSETQQRPQQRRLRTSLKWSNNKRQGWAGSKDRGTKRGH